MPTPTYRPCEKCNATVRVEGRTLTGEQPPPVHIDGPAEGSTDCA